MMNFCFVHFDCKVSNLCTLIKIYKNDKDCVYSLLCVYVCMCLKFFSTFNLRACSKSNYPLKWTKSNEFGQFLRVGVLVSWVRLPFFFFIWWVRLGACQ